MNWRLIVPIAILAAAVACGSPGPVEIPARDIPFPLTRVQTSAAPEPRTRSFQVAFVRRGRLAMVERRVRSRLGLEEIVARALLAGPTKQERDRGLSTSVPPATRLLGIETFVGGVAEIDLSREFQAAGASRGFLLRVAQVVVSLSGIEEVTAVRISIDGEVVAVPIDGGRTVTRPVTPADYAERLPGA